MATSVSNLSLGIVTGTMAQQQRYQDMAERLGAKIVVSLLTYQTEWDSWLEEGQVDAWLVCVDWEQDGASAWSRGLEEWLLQVTQPLLIDEAGIPDQQDPGYQDWLQRWSRKLREMSSVHQEVAVWPRQIWLLAASTGGPEAVSEFLAELPAGLDVSFIYLQHTQLQAEPYLLKVLSQKSSYPLLLAEQGRALKSGQVMMLSSRKAVKLNTQGVFVEQEQGWEGFFSPSIDQFVYQYMHSFSKRKNAPSHGMIVFSGMGEDGAAACRYAKQLGASVWTQSPESCVSPYMPIAAAEAVDVDFSGSPAELAQHLAQLIQ